MGIREGCHSLFILVNFSPIRLNKQFVVGWGIGFGRRIERKLLSTLSTDFSGSHNGP